jgi:arylsulfatase A-like enzyme
LAAWNMRREPARSLVVVTGDHGEEFFEHGGKGHQRSVFEELVRVPLIVRWPGHVPAGRLVDTPVINTDWLPTLGEIARARTPRNLDGVSIASLLLGRGQPKPRPFYWHFPHYTNQGSQPAGAIRDGDWKLVEHFEDGRTELFNLTTDIGEATDLSARERRRVTRMKRQLEAWRQHVDAQTNAPNPDFKPTLHAKLYADFKPSTFDPLHADDATWARVAEWRKQMDAVLGLAITVSPVKAAERKPNILVVLADQWRAQAFGFAGDPNAKTPNFDRLASESVRFINAVAGLPVCSPTRASLLTGQRPLTHGVFLNDVPLNPNATTIAKVLKVEGYDTGRLRSDATCRCSPCRSLRPSKPWRWLSRWD